MFLKDDSGNYLNIGGVGKRVKAKLPAGVYTFHSGMQGAMFVPSEVAVNKYVPVPMPEMEAVRQECIEFFDPALRQRVKDCGQLNKRGILLHGPAGTGKTRLMQHIVEEAAKDANAITINDIEVRELEEAVRAIRDSDPNRSIVVIWDEFDRVAELREEALLQWLDGVYSVDNIMFVGCTNFITKVPKRIYSRPSRFGLVKRIGFMNQDARLAFVQGSYPDIDPEIAEQLATMTTGLSLDMTKEVALLHYVRGYTPEQIEQRLATSAAELNAAEADKPDPAEEKKLGRNGTGRLLRRLLNSEDNDNESF